MTDQVNMTRSGHNDEIAILQFSLETVFYCSLHPHLYISIVAAVKVVEV
jgi:hypothetical protein